MLPLPPFGLWVPVLALYAVALLLAVAALAEGEDTPRARVHFFLSVLGLGVFTYYQGRSVLGGLMMAGYPGRADSRAVRGRSAAGRSPGAAKADRLLAGSLLFLLAVCVPSLASVAPAWYGHIAAKVRVTRRGETDVVMRDALFLRRHFRPGDKVLIMSYTSGLYHALTGTTNPLGIPSDSEFDLSTGHRQGG